MNKTSVIPADSKPRISRHELLLTAAYLITLFPDGTDDKLTTSIGKGKVVTTGETELCEYVVKHNRAAIREWIMFNRSLYKLAALKRISVKRVKINYKKLNYGSKMHLKKMKCSEKNSVDNTRKKSKENPS